MTRRSVVRALLVALALVLPAAAGAQQGWFGTNKIQ